MNLSRTTLLLTRPEEASLRFAAEAEARLGRFASVVVAPLMKIVPVAFDLPDGAPAAWIFTSAQAVPEIAARIDARGARAWCVGARTAAAARDAGFDPCAVAPDAEALLAEITAASPPGVLLHAAGRHRRGDIAEALRAAGVRAQTVTVYDQQAQPLTDTTRRLLSKPGDILAPLFSPRSAGLLRDAATGRRALLHAVAISPAAAAEWQARPGEGLRVAESPDAEGILAAMVSLFDADRSA